MCRGMKLRACRADRLDLPLMARRNARREECEARQRGGTTVPLPSWSLSVSGYLRTTSRCQDAGLQGMSESFSMEKWILAATGGSYRAWQDLAGWRCGDGSLPYSLRSWTSFFPITSISISSLSASSLLAFAESSIATSIRSYQSTAQSS
jgi:hypothetical protein